MTAYIRENGKGGCYGCGWGGRQADAGVNITSARRQRAADRRNRFRIGRGCHLRSWLTAAVDPALLGEVGCAGSTWVDWRDLDDKQVCNEDRLVSFPKQIDSGLAIVRTIVGRIGARIELGDIEPAAQAARMRTLMRPSRRRRRVRRMPSPTECRRQVDSRLDAPRIGPIHPANSDRPPPAGTRPARSAGSRPPRPCIARLVAFPCLGNACCVKPAPDSHACLRIVHSLA